MHRVCFFHLVLNYYSYISGLIRRNDNPVATMMDAISENHGGHIDLDNSVVNKLARSNPKVAILSSEAKVGTEAEHNMSIREAIRRYPKAVAWSILFSTAIILEGYDIALVTAFFAYPLFRSS